MSSYLLSVVSVTWWRESHGGGGLQLLLAQPAGQVVIAVRLTALPGVFTHMPN
jgi:hypothetical protein